MQSLRTVLVSSLAIFASACGNLQSLKVAAPPSDLSGKPIRVVASVPAVNEINPRANPIGKDGIYIVQTKGGSLVAGLLFGPLGVAMNSANIESKNAELAKSAQASELLQLKPAQELAAVWANNPVESNSAGKDEMSVSPYIILYSDDEKKEVFSLAGLKLTAGNKLQASGKPWTGHYIYALPNNIPAAYLSGTIAPEALASYRSELQKAYRELHEEMKRDFSGNQRTYQLASVQSPVLKASTIGFAGFTSGDILQEANGKLIAKVNIENYGPAMDRSIPYFVWIFPNANQYSFNLGPEARK
ncbi:hypothetical protein [Undibacterium sp. Ji49W]|uniref:hypothetical protein n=1 Tax=Undibacterium sp. Ji49W TaxID=3413040 RepID=UPI003BF0192D